MVILEYRGGLGNQMFQYCFYKLLMYRKKTVQCKITNDPNSHLPFRLNIFPNVLYKEVDEKLYNRMMEEYLNRSLFRKIKDKLIPQSSMVYKENQDRSYDTNLFEIDNKIIYGYFQSLYYIEPIKDIIRKEFEFPYGEHTLFDLVSSLGNNTVSLHVRRGDYLDFPEIYGGICTLEYYKSAVQYFMSKGITDFIVLSNDIEWVQKNLDLKNAIYIKADMFQNYQDWYDMYIMSHSHHNIIANSSFSWWGAWLNKHLDKIVITPPYFDNQHKNKYLIDEGWIVMNG